MRRLILWKLSPVDLLQSGQQQAEPPPEQPPEEQPPGVPNVEEQTDLLGNVPVQ